MNITKATEAYISQRPSVKDCIKQKLVNYSALSRKISADTGIRNFDAILMACRRYAYKVRGEEIREQKIMEIVRKSKVEIKNKRIAAVLEKSHHGSLAEMEKQIKKDRETIHIIEGANAITIVTSQDYLDLIKKSFRNEIIAINKGLVEIHVKSPPDIEKTPGVLTYLCSLFSDSSINIVENMSCWTDTLFLINEKDVPKAMEALES